MRSHKEQRSIPAPAPWAAKGLSPLCYFWHLLLRSSLWGAARAGSYGEGAQGATGSAARGTRGWKGCRGGGLPAGQRRRQRQPGLGALGVSPGCSTACSCLGRRPLAPSRVCSASLGPALAGAAAGAPLRRAVNKARRSSMARESRPEAGCPRRGRRPRWTRANAQRSQTVSRDRHCLSCSVT